MGWVEVWVFIFVVRMVCLIMDLEFFFLGWFCNKEIIYMQLSFFGGRYCSIKVSL